METRLVSSCNKVILILAFVLVGITCLDEFNANLGNETPQKIKNKQEIEKCSGKGIYSNFDCFCVYGYVTFPENSDKKCNYAQRSYYMTIFLSFFLGFLGADMFYLGYTIRGLIKCFLPIGSLFVLLFLQNMGAQDKFSNKYYSILVPFGVLIFLWAIDLILIYSEDSNGVPLI